MIIEYIIYALESILVIFLLFRYIPKEKIREAHVAYLFKLVITWSFGLVVVEYGFIKYPIRFFPYATRATFLFEFFLYPAICAIFVVNYPEKKSAIQKLKYYFYYCTTLTIIEVIEERYTNVIEYIRWNWFLTWTLFFITFYISHKYSKWFFRKIKIL
ncbi:hypothetical protein NBE98_17490 [Clostridium swellfunianum]|uniref:CBO0543 family protein n=1 Tax=Clostridium swellfunianum TaxID=1367462 RepID=UPI00202F747E|nr:CBO0543 family protein [Clostridium swellfunianum]MCM0650163.1 hypothetical protein [Clostridium swellfunianum]